MGKTKGKKSRRNIYKHEIDLVDLNIKNRPREEFRISLETVKYRGYRVEKLADGREIVITKPGGKRVLYGQVKREDFMVWIYDPKDTSLWLISHKDIYSDIEKESAASPVAALEVIDALERVCNGEDPDSVLSSTNLNKTTGIPPDAILKAYKWIWGQEDCNYPGGEGRDMSMKEIRELGKTIKKKLADST